MHYLRELLAERNLAMRHFTKLIGIKSTKTVDSYIHGIGMLPENREKIERGIRVLESYDAVCPSFDYGRHYSTACKRTWGDLNREYLKYMWGTCEYDEGFRELFEAIK